MWSGALVSAALATVLPGPGTIYLGQELSFKRPVKIDDTLTVKLTVAKKEEKNRVIIDCLVSNQKDETVVTGTATVMAPTEKLSIDKPTLPPITIGGSEI